MKHWRQKNQNISYWDDDIRGGLRGTAHLAGLRSASMRSLASKQEVTFCSRSPAITPPGNKDVIKRPDVQLGARPLLSRKINMPQFPRSIRSGLLRQHSDSTVFDFPSKAHPSRNSLELHLARLHLTYWNNVSSHYIICFSLTPALHLDNCDPMLRLFSLSHNLKSFDILSALACGRGLTKPAKIFTYEWTKPLHSWPTWAPTSGTARAVSSMPIVPAL